eukprot:17645_1
MGCCSSNTTSNPSDESAPNESKANVSAALVVNDESSDEEIRAYWTDQRMANATPKSFPEAVEARTEDEVKESKEEITGDEEVLTRESIFPQGYEELDVESPDLTNGQQSPVSNTQPDPYCWYGKLHFVQNGQNMVATAACLSEANGKMNLLITAAHCLFDRPSQTWVSNLQFTSSKDGSKYTWEVMAIPIAWKTSSGSDVQWDYGMVRVRDHSSLGGVGWSIGGNTTSPSTNATILAIGYSGGKSTLYQCQGTNNGPVSQGIFNMDSNMQPGCSGGPWLNANGSFPHINTIGLNSWTTGTTMRSPVMTITMWNKLIVTAQTGKPQ